MIRAIIFAIIGVPLGVVCQAITIYTFHRIFMPQLLKDGQYVLLLFFTAPVGGLLGLISGVSIALYMKDDSRASIVTLLVGGAICAILTLATSLLYNGEKVRGQFLEVLLSVCGIPLIWSVLLISVGLVLLNRRS